MPYGMKGGDTPESDKWMESCVTKVMKQGKDKGAAIAICKATHEKSKGDEKKAEFILTEILAAKTDDHDMEEDSPEEEFMDQCIMKMSKKGMTGEKAVLACKNLWNKSNKNKAKAQILFHLLNLDN
jgi:hypothetical protein